MLKYSQAGGFNDRFLVDIDYSWIFDCQVRDRSLIMGQGVWRKIRGGGSLEKKSQQGGGVPKLFCLMRGGLEKNKLVSSDYPCQRNKHCRIPCTHVNLDHSKCEVWNQNLYDRWTKLVICQSNNDNCLVDFANQKYKPLVFHEWTLDCFI